MPDQKDGDPVDRGSVTVRVMSLWGGHRPRALGVQQMFFSTDYPFERMEDAARWFDDTPVSDSERLQVGRTNAIKLFKLNLK